jgi:hypothetical protein
MHMKPINKAPLLPALVAALMLAQLACEDKSAGPDPVETFQLAFLGAYADEEHGDRGVIMLDIESDGSGLAGEAVIRSRVDEDPYIHVYLKGSTDGEDIELALDTDKVPYQYELTILATRGPGDDLEGSFSYPSGGLEAEFEASALEQADAAVEAYVDLDVSTGGLAFDGEDIWVSTVTRDHIIMSLGGAFIDTVVVLREGAHWTSDALTSDGTHLWGHLPVTVSDGGVIRNESEIEKFTKEGVIVDSFRIPHRTTGLASDGEYLWSLKAESDSLFRLDGEGTILEAIEVPLPDLVDIDYDGAYFWGIGWFMKRLYKMDGAGDVLRVYHLPCEDGNVFPSGIVFDGEHFWYGLNTVYLDSRIYKVTVGP